MRALFLLSFAAASMAALANDANLSFGGSPKLMSGQSSVRMLREKIVMNVSLATTKVTCDFWFKNNRPATTLRVGFPDEGNATEEPPQNGVLSSNFTYFKSWVDGKPVATKLIEGDLETWHVKSVHFGKAVVHVRDEYAMPTGTGIAEAGKQEGNCHWTRYTVHTGASWKGTIGKTELEVHFSKKDFPTGVHPVDYKKLATGDSGRELKSAHFPKTGTVLCKGISRPTRKGTTLYFQRTNWRPTEQDDLNLWFAFSSRG